MVEVQRLACDVVGEVMAGRAGFRAASCAASATGAYRSGWRRAAGHQLRYIAVSLGPAHVLLDQLLQRPLKDERVRQLLRVALYQLAHTRAAPYAIVDHAVNTSVALGEPAAKGLVNAVLRSFLRQSEALLAAARGTEAGGYSHPQWWVDKLRAQYPEHYRDILTKSNRHPPLTLRVNRRHITVDHYLERLAAAGIKAQALGGAAVMLERPVPMAQIPGFADGAVSVQDAAAQHAAGYLDLQPGQRVLDACAAPGGKTAHILECENVELVAGPTTTQSVWSVCDRT